MTKRRTLSRQQHYRPERRFPRWLSCVDGVDAASQHHPAPGPNQPVDGAGWNPTAQCLSPRNDTTLQLGELPARLRHVEWHLTSLVGWALTREPQLLTCG